MKKFILSTIFFVLFFISAPSFALNAPHLTVTTSGVNVSLSWASVPGATGYNLVYAPYPYTDSTNIEVVNLGNQASLSVDLWDGAAFYVAITATNGIEISAYSNIELFRLSASSPSDPSPPPTGSPVTDIVLNYRVLVEYFEYLTPEQVAGIFRTLDDTDLLNLGIYSPFGGLVHYYACQADSSLLFAGGSGTSVSCYEQQISWAETAQLTNDPTAYAFSQRDALLISIKCGTGEIDRGSCAAYIGTMSDYGAMINDTSMRIINNIGGNCYLGEPGCVP